MEAMLPKALRFYAGVGLLSTREHSERCGSSKDAPQTRNATGKEVRSPSQNRTDSTTSQFMDRNKGSIQGLKKPICVDLDACEEEHLYNTRTISKMDTPNVEDEHVLVPPCCCRTGRPRDFDHI